MRLTDALTHPERPFVIRRVCQRFGCQTTHDEPWDPPAFDHTAQEVALGDYRLDVAAMQGQSVVFGFEVYYSHRVGHVKAAELGVPWLEVQAESTAHDPYVLCPVVNERITGDDEQSLRWALRTTWARLPEKLTWRLNEPVLLGSRHEDTVVPARLVDLIFHARVEASSFLQPWRCSPCAEYEAAQSAPRRG